jgi:hypothetical protein
MSTIEDERGMFGPDERIAMRDIGIRIEIPEPAVNPVSVDGTVPPPIDLDGVLAFYPGEEPHKNVGSIAKTMQKIHELSTQIACTDAFQHASTVHRMAQIRADLTRHLPDVF